ncbi:hypothetical protein BU14_0074s0018 [Porphyra umbilicalis]|uniref:Uncharacterized protein n=1 Tax=Porphyra umbilicalis TaxID=2786 RepID=A0A1X6PFF4_PORUM|nr:hypothetical protein BU14_0074s0018 [Porphyra umbilicalis]|eukprot:OSX79587.1 hypothetical protein BU14_0074s0018 [Porphyra umbilicalis]
MSGATAAPGGKRRPRRALTPPSSRPRSHPPTPPPTPPTPSRWTVRNSARLTAGGNAVVRSDTSSPSTTIVPDVVCGWYSPAAHTRDTPVTMAAPPVALTRRSPTAMAAAATSRSLVTT